MIVFPCLIYIARILCYLASLRLIYFTRLKNFVAHNNFQFILTLRNGKQSYLNGTGIKATATLNKRFVNGLDL